MTFSLQLSDDVIEVRDWVHKFAADVIRPAASEWDEREETPWPVIQEAAKVGLYSPDFFAQQAAEPTGLGMLTAFEEMFWGDAGIALSIMGTGLAAAALAGNGTPEQLGRWLPEMFGTADEPKLGAFCSSEPDAGSDVGAIRTRARYDEATARVGAQRHQDVGDQRRHRQRAHRGGIGLPRARHPRAGHVRRPGGHQRLGAGAEVQEARHSGVAHRRGGAGQRPPARGPHPRRAGEVRGADRPRQVRAPRRAGRRR